MLERSEASRRLEENIDILAGVEHERWSKWQRYLHKQSIRQPDGSLLIPAELVARWERQIQTKFADLSEAERESDREQVRNYLPAVLDALCSSTR